MKFLLIILTSLFWWCCNSFYYNARGISLSFPRRKLLQPLSLVELPSQVTPIDINDELKSSFLSYSLSTILGRSLPDVRDGLKPVHRRILYAMYRLGLSPESGFRKCARVVGEVLGKFHPHGDQSVYDAMVRMAQDFVMQHTLVNGHGNFGSVDGDPPAAMRYTECKLSKISNEILFQNIDEDVIDYIPNFDGNELEPVILPAKFPLLLLNGVSGIAVGMATNIPPFNLAELSDAIFALIDNPNITALELASFVPGPDFPTGGIILGKKDSVDLISTGSGRIVVRAKCHNEDIKVSGKTSRKSLVFTELPYLVNKASLVESIAQLVNDKTIEGIADIRDESDRNGIRVVIELKRDVDPDLMEGILYSRTELQKAFPGSMVALTDGGKSPELLNLREIISNFLSFRFETLTRQSRYRLNNMKKRFHIVEGLIKAVASIDSIIQVIRNNTSSESMKRNLMGTFNFTEDQTDAVLGLRLSRLSTLEDDKLSAEKNDLEKNILALENMLSNSSLIYDHMKNEIMDIKQKFGQPRKSAISDSFSIFEQSSFVNNESCVIILTRNGYITRLSLDEFAAQGRGTKGKSGTKLLGDSDAVTQIFTCNSKDNLLFFSQSGKCFASKAYEIPSSSRVARGTPLHHLIPIDSSESMPIIAPIQEQDDNIVLVSKRGRINMLPLSLFANITRRGLTAISLSSNDSLVFARPLVLSQSSEGGDVVVVSRNGRLNRFPLSQLKHRGRLSMGSKLGSKLNDIAGVDLTSNSTSDEFVLIATAKGYGKLVPMSSIVIKSNQACSGSQAIKFKNISTSGADKDYVAGMKVCSMSDEVVFSTRRSSVVRIRVNEFPIQSKKATGATLIKLPSDDLLTSIEIIQPVLQNISSSTLFE